MKLQIIRFSQDVDLENLESTMNFLVVRREDGSTFRIPVPEETIQVLMSEAGGGKVEEHQEGPTPRKAPYEQTVPQEDPDDPEPVEPPPEEATEFGNDNVMTGDADGITGQVSLTREELLVEGINPDNVDRPVLPPVRQSRILKRIGSKALPQQRLVPDEGDDGVPSL